MVSSTLIKNKEEIIQNWINGQIKDPRIREDKFIQETLHFQSMEFLNALIDVIVDLEIKSSAFKGKIISKEKLDKLLTAAIFQEEQILTMFPKFVSLLNILKEMTVKRENIGFKPLEIASAILLFRDIWMPYLNTLYQAYPEILVSEVASVSKLIDTLALLTYQKIVQRREDVILQQMEDIFELSIPIIQVWKGILISPLIGTLDSQRTALLVEKLLKSIVETGSRLALIDITGVLTVDSKTAQYLIDTVHAIQLLGATAIITGISPSIAQTMVRIGIKFTDITTKSSLDAGLAVALDTLGLKVVTKDE